MVSDIEIVFRLVLAAVIGLMIGFARRRKAAGIRTFSLISLGSAIFTVISISGPIGDAINYDPMRVIAQIVAGIGFLGLGVIWKQGVGQPTGLTTAAAIWATAAVGVLIGLGMWVEVATGALLILVILYSKKPLEGKE
ncbi:MAG: MgtC/SapB family protein [Candidatus Micrarchaeota archaeon]